MIRNSPGCADQPESLRYHDVIGVKSPVEPADLMSKKSVPFIGSGESPLLIAEPFMLTSSFMPSRLEFS